MRFTEAAGEVKMLQLRSSLPEMNAHGLGKQRFIRL